MRSLMLKLWAFVRGLVKCILFLAVAFALYLAGYEIYARQVIHQVIPMCEDSRTRLEGPLSEEFRYQIAVELIRKGEEYVEKNERIYTTLEGLYDLQYDKIALWIIYPEKFHGKPPDHDDPKVQEILETWRASDVSDNVSAEWCHVLEAGASKNGIDAEARRKNPDIWPPDKWPVPPVLAE